MPIVQQVAALLVIAWLPGAAIFRAPILDRARREALDAEERLFWQVMISTASALIIVLSLAAVGRYRFEYLLAGQCVAIAGLANHLADDSLAPRGSAIACDPALHVSAVEENHGVGWRIARAAWRNNGRLPRRRVLRVGNLCE